MKSLKEMKPGERGSVLSIDKGSGMKTRLLEMGVVKGAEVLVVRLAPFGDPIEVSIKGYNLTLRGDEASKINIQVDG